MRHLLKKISLVGGKKSKPKAKPATLKPPQVGDMQLAASYSYSEILDLISDGPIEGLVNKNGLRLGNKDILQGIYLDDTVVAVSNDLVVESQATYNTSFTATNSTYIKSLKQFFINLQNLNITTIANISADKNYKTITSFNFILSENTESTTLNINYFDDYDAQILNGGFIRNTNYVYGVTNNDNNGNYINTYPLAFNQFVKGDLRFTPGVRGAANKYSLLQSYDPYVQITNIYLNDIIANQLSNIQTLINSYGSYTAYEKQYLTNMFNNNFGNDWQTRITTSLSDWAYTPAIFDYKTDMIFVIKVDGQQIIDAGKSLIENTILQKFKFVFEDSAGSNLTDSNVKIYDFILPRINDNGTTTGRCYGSCVVVIKGILKFFIDTSKVTEYGKFTSYLAYSIPITSINMLANVSKLSLKKISTETLNNPNPQKYNYANILAEYRSGEEFQNPFKFFKHALIDKSYNSPLIGPFKTAGQVQRIVENTSMLSKNALSLNIGQSAIPTTEGSLDNSRVAAGDFSNWNKSQTDFNESAISVKHIINNPNVSQVFVTILISTLSDTLTTTQQNVIEAGVNYPTIVNVEIETGSIDVKGVETSAKTRRFKILSLIQSPTYIDIGNPDGSTYSSSDYNFITEYTPNAGDTIFSAFVLPSVEQTESALDSSAKRYIKVTKLSTETNSSLITKDISLAKITEIIPLNFNYPHSAIVGTKIDSRSFSNIPIRTYDCKLKQVRVPSNYYPLLSNGKDKRYYYTEAEFNTTNKQDKLIYDGDWNGTFKKELQWTDNPAWILFDLLTNERYGLGQYMDESQIDIFDLYKIARFCDAVDDFGYFEGVSDNAGGLEPRFSCNIMFQDGMKVFDALNTIASLFRGIIYYNNSQINFVDDRPKDTIALFTNTNVKDGIFNYTNYRRDEQFNSIEVVYIDRFENFLTKVEYIEDEEDIRKRGIFKKTINANGVTSRAMARRLGQHIIFQTIKENQSVSFVSGLESLLCKPGDLIIIEDELKSLKSNFGKVLDINTSTGSIRLNEQFITGEFNDKLTVYTPTGYSTNDELNALANSRRSRINDSGFYLTTGGWLSTFNYLTGFYQFSGYSNGFDEDKISTNDILRSQYAAYTGTGFNFCYFDNIFTGWVLGSGTAFTSNNSYNKFIFDASNHDFTEVNRGTGYYYDSAISSGRSGAFLTALNGQVSGANSKFRDISGLELQMTAGLLDSDISLTSPSQITTFDISGIVQYEYGCEAFVDQQDINYSLVQFVKQGSVYRFQRKLADDQIYKVISIKEENPNEYSLICTKFNTGKYALIENDKSIENQSNTYSYTLSQKIGDTTYRVLSSPTIESVTTGIDPLNSQFYISGQWRPVLYANGYNIKLYQPNGVIQQQTVQSSITGIKFYIEGIGNYSYRVNASGSYTNASVDPNTYFDSNYSVSGLFLVYDGALLDYDRPFLSTVTIL
jgi:hypothetical protein